MPRIPRLTNVRIAPDALLSAEAAIVARIDGRVSESELASQLSLDPTFVSSFLDALAGKGQIEFVVQGLEEEATLGLDPERRERIRCLFERLEELTFYELLGITEQADKKQVKSAYYALAPEFHPDKYFRKNLGSYRHQIELIFSRITAAHDVLTSPKRAEYDAYLAQSRSNRAMDDLLSRGQEEAALVVAAVETSVPPDPPPQPSKPLESLPVNIDPEEARRQRREALARKLLGGQRRPGIAAPSSRSDSSPRERPELNSEATQRAAEALRLRHEAAVAEARREQLTKYLEQGGTALDAKDYAAAVNSYRIAASLSPDDPTIQITCKSAMQLAAAALADGYWKQAQYEASQERWAEAALSYSKVCAGRPNDATAHERVAHATLHSSTNARRAVEFARKAVELNPTVPEFRVTLARAYAAAGLEKSAQGELQRALDLAPNDPKIQAMVANARSTSPKSRKLG